MPTDISVPPFCLSSVKQQSALYSFVGPQHHAVSNVGTEIVSSIAAERMPSASCISSPLQDHHRVVPSAATTQWLRSSKRSRTTNRLARSSAHHSYRTSTRLTDCHRSWTCLGTVTRLRSCTRVVTIRAQRCLLLHFRTRKVKNARLPRVASRGRKNTIKLLKLTEACRANFGEKCIQPSSTQCARSRFIQNSFVRWHTTHCEHQVRNTCAKYAHRSKKFDHWSDSSSKKSQCKPTMMMVSCGLK